MELCHHCHHREDPTISADEQLLLPMPPHAQTMMLLLLHCLHQQDKDKERYR
jgi:hypothetical protein